MCIAEIKCIEGSVSQYFDLGLSCCFVVVFFVCVCVWGGGGGHPNFHFR